MKYLTPLLLCLAFILVFWACSKTDQTSTTDTENMQDQLITEAKGYFEKEVLLSSHSTNTRKTNAGPKNIKKTPKWQSAYIRNISIGKAVAIPLAFNDRISVKHNGTQANVPISRYSYLLIYRDRAQHMHHEVVFVIPDTAYLRNSKDFTGTIIIRDWQGAFIKGYRYDDGKVISNIKDVGLTKKGDGSLYRPAPYECGLEDWYTCVSTDGGSTFYCIYEYTEPIICFGDDGSSGGGSGGGGGGSDNPDGDDYPPPSGGGSGGAPAGTNSIDTIGIDPSVTTPCIRDGIKLATGPGLTNSVTTIFNKLFSGSDEYHVDFYEGSIGNTTLADTRPANNYNFEITFNTQLLAHSSKELIVSTALHEMIHGMFEVRKRMNNDPLTWGEAFQHNVMAAGYIEGISAALKEIFPNIPAEDATALSWEGLQETLAWEAFKQSNPSGANDMLLKGDQYEQGHTKGTRCP